MTFIPVRHVLLVTMQGHAPARVHFSTIHDTGGNHDLESKKKTHKVPGKTQPFMTPWF
jgi:hypothetical protein